MESEHILLICAGGVFLITFLVYLFYAAKRMKERKAGNLHLREVYGSKNLQKMEYDHAFYDEDARGLVYSGEGQVTIDELIGSEATNRDRGGRQAEDLIFAKIENEGVEEITGNFKP